MAQALTTRSKATDLRPCIAMLGIRSLLWALSKGKGSLAWWLSLRIFPLGVVRAEETRGDIVHESPECHCISMVWPWSCLLTLREGHEGKTMPPPGVLEAHGRLLSVLELKRQPWLRPGDHGTERGTVWTGENFWCEGEYREFTLAQMWFIGGRREQRKLERMWRVGLEKETSNFWQQEPRRGLESHSAHVTCGLRASRSWSWRTVRPFLGSLCRRIALRLRSAWAAQWDPATRKLQTNKQTSRQNHQREDLRHPQRKCRLVRQRRQTWPWHSQCSSLPLGKPEFWAFSQSM